MKYIKYITIILAFVFVFIHKSFAVENEFTAFITTDSMHIDGVGDERVWDSATWYPMKYVWLPYNDEVDSLDFSGRFKAAWDSTRLYLLVEIVDDSLYDGHVDPLDNYYQDDCVEVFLDEDKSGGLHNDASVAFNAFAMHVSTLFDVVDNGLTGTALFNSLITAALTAKDSLYTWELAIKVYPSTYNQSSPGDPVKLTANKVMGFSLAYCDDDGSNVRENFIASTYVTEANQNNSWLDASIFGSMTLFDPNYVPTVPSAIKDFNESVISFYPNPAGDIIYFTLNETIDKTEMVRIIDVSGQVVYEQQLQNNSMNGNINVDDINRGIYIMQLVSDQSSYSQQIIIY